ncbi:DUF58 domain-containing protein [Flavobacteriales bacterium]|mgnify:CR=1 FL=1|jgi:uncharacterized protein (DUF58 family)|nr:DUF58 domain-containing protein [Flavobacteriales bacterium]|tara:strand:+ start:493 stop:1416 length:924 start_codon:yes stop_codon:yes gene_type:complete
MEKLEKYKLNNIEFFANQVVEGFITGKHKSPYHGFSVEFAEHRLYNSGESTKNIDWKLFARTEKLFVKRFEEETNLRCQIIIDTSSSMFYPQFNNPTLEKPNKILFSVYASAVLINVLKRQRDAIGLTTYANDIETHILPKTSLKHQRILFDKLKSILDIDPLNNKRKSSLVNSIHETAERIHKRSLVILFSDIISNDSSLEEIFDSIRHLKHKKHEVVIFYLAENKTEINLEFENKPHNFIDVETGEELKLNPSNFKDQYIKESNEYLKRLKLKSLEHKIDLVEVDINKGFEDIISSYLLKRQKMF